MDFSCAFPPGPNAVDYVVLAEALGYHRAWLYDSPALYGDVWVALAQSAMRTRRIGLGPGVLVPSFRHPLAQASAIATLEQLAPGRMAVAIGTGFSGRMALGQRPLHWSVVADYIRTLRTLLLGQTVEIDGAAVRMMHPSGYAPLRPIDVPILVAANGPKGLRVARELGDGIMCVARPQPGFPWCALLAFGTVLEPGEDPGSPRAVAAVGPGLAVVYHGIYETGGAAVDGFPGGAQWRATIEAIPKPVRHLAVHDLHLVGVTERDQPLLNGEMIKAMTWTGTTPELRARIADAEAAGATEIIYAPLGPQMPVELAAFARMAGL